MVQDCVKTAREERDAAPSPIIGIRQADNNVDRIATRTTPMEPGAREEVRI
jgi:hypothetical protein